MDVLIEHQWPVVQGTRQPEAIIDEYLLAASVSGIHTAKLRQRNMGFVHDHQIIIVHRGEIVLHRIGGFTGFFACEVARIVFDSFADPCRFEHFEIELCPLLEPIVFDHTSLLLVVGESFSQLLLDTFDGTGKFLLADDKLIGCVDRNFLLILSLLSC